MPHKEKHIPGYRGFVKGIKSENVFASSFGRTTNASIDNKISRGYDFSDKERYVSVNQLTFANKNSFKDAKVTNPFLEQKLIFTQSGQQQMTETKLFLTYEEAMK